MTDRSSEPSNELSGELLTLASSLALEAGRTVVKMRDEVAGAADTKSSPTDPVTEADRRAEAIIVDGILAARPHDGILGEEGAAHQGKSGVVWHIDPIDGTTNYVYGIPAYGVSVAAEVEGTMTVGVVFNPVSDELFAAKRRGGAFLNGEPIHTSRPSGLDQSLVATGFGYQAERRARQAAVVNALLPRVRDIRRIGSAALDLCNVACGRVDAYFEAGLNRWDFAAGWLIATEAGALCGALDGGPPDERFFLATAPEVHDVLRDLLISLNADAVTDLIA